VIDRRSFVSSIALAALLAPLVGEGQPPAKVHRIGYVGNSSPSLEPKLIGAFVMGCATSATWRVRTSTSSTGGPKGDTSGFLISWQN
jgi:hypothetical protein